jgi:hypothetical protein
MPKPRKPAPFDGPSFSADGGAEVPVPANDDHRLAADMVMAA